ncbi:MAG TPA: phasin family protein [Elainellaceae cyanobacterium]
MAGLGDVVQKAFYLGVGIASYAGEKAGQTLVEVRQQAQKIADEMVARGELTADEARRMVDDMVGRAQQTYTSEAKSSSESSPREPRRIEILSDDDVPESKPPSATNDLRKQVSDLEEELRRLKNEGRT